MIGHQETLDNFAYRRFFCLLINVTEAFLLKAHQSTNFYMEQKTLLLHSFSLFT